MRKTSLSSVLCLLSSLSVLPAFAGPVTNTLVYVAELGKFRSDGQVETVNLTTNDVTMTVALYNTDASGRTPLWQRRLAVPVWGGQFSVELDDARGVNDDLLPAPKYASLADVFANAAPADAWYVGISRVRLGDDTAPLPGMDDAEKVGKISAVPFAIEAERAAGARGDFTVAGRATVSSVSSDGTVAVTGLATFMDKSTCEKNVVFGANGGLVVTGTLSLRSLDASGGRAVITAPNVNATGLFQVGDLTVFGGDVTAFTPASAGLPTLTNVTAKGTLVAGSGVSALSVPADTVTVNGLLTLQQGGLISWHDVGELTPLLVATDGVYPKGATVTDDSSHGTSTNTFSNTSGREQLLTFVTASSAGATATVTATSGSATETWALAGPDAGGNAAVTLTSLCPLSAVGTDKAQVSGVTLLSHTVKELSK